MFLETHENDITYFLDLGNVSLKKDMHFIMLVFSSIDCSQSLQGVSEAERSVTGAGESY